MNQDVTYEQSASFSLSKVFAWMFLALGVTALTAYGFAALLGMGFISPDAYLIVLGVSVVLMFIESFVIQYRVIRNHKSMIVPFIIYAITMGFMMSSIILVVDSMYLILAFGVSAGLFGIMALYGYTTKRSLNRMGSVAFMLLAGSLLISLFNIFIGSSEVDWIVSFVSFAAIMLFVSVDMWRLKSIINSGVDSPNICMYCAFQLYIDFIYIFMRVLSFIIRYTNNN